MTITIPNNAERISLRSANTKRPPVIQDDWSFNDGFSPRMQRFGENDERATLALAGRLKLEVESHQNQPEIPGQEYAKEELPGQTQYIGVIHNGQEYRGAVAIFMEDTGSVMFSEYRWADKPAV